jgi:hypothetical protein
MTIENTNTSNKDQTVVVRVGTNNPGVYKDITLTVKTTIDYNITPAENLVCNYNVGTMSGGTSDSKRFYWDDAQGNGKRLQLKNTDGNIVFDGSKATSRNSIWYPEQCIISDNLPEEFTAMMLISVTSGDATAFVNGDTMNQYSAHSERIYIKGGNNIAFYQNVAVAEKVTVSDMFSKKIVIGETYNANGEVTAFLVTEDGTLYQTTAAESLYENTSVMGNLKAFNGTPLNSGFVGSFYQMLMFDKVLSGEELSSFATQMFDKNS